ncbi:MAG: hypothetical protein JW779_05800 [Candidatus Thorarchaeota archaeon]|nr:hypothetical protein [Candidatus Thorarchaeota archaeon]
METRIHDINVVADLKWNQRAVTLLDPCDTMDNFEKDPNFGWGTVSAGELYVPSGQSYMTSTGIPTTPAGWHGPTYVYELEAPFSLYNLYLFSIHGELFQYYDQMGLTEIALFDVDKQPVLYMYWGDSWLGENKGYFHVVYYPQGGSAVSDTTGYIYTSFYRIGEFRVIGGHVTYKIKDPGGTLQSGDMGAVANPYRQIKYLAIRMERYSGYAMNDMRLHAVNLYADQETLVPEPEAADGTPEGYNPCPEATSFVDLLVGMAIANTVSWWTGWWPLLHSRTTGTLASGATYAYQMSVDLLSNVAMEDFAVDTPADDQLTDEQINLMAQTSVLDLFAEAFTIDAAILWGASIVMGTIDILLAVITKVPTPPQLVLLAVLVLAYTGAMLLGLAALWEGLLSGRISASAAYAILVVTLTSLVFEGILASINGWKIFADWWNHYKQASKKLWAKRYCFMSWVIFCVKMMFIAIVLAMTVRVYDFWIQGY